MSDEVSCWAEGSKEENHVLRDTCDAGRWSYWILFQRDRPPLLMETARRQHDGHAEKRKSQPRLREILRSDQGLNGIITK